ncbi:MAG TPA: glycosyltransferase family 39 protein [Pyrinomonadaceae bacterium]
MKKKVVRDKGQAARRPASRLAAWLDAPTVGLVLAVKALLFLYGAQAFVLWKNERLGSFYDWLAIWNRWDAPHYLDIARAGYVSQGVEARWIVFYPLYPWLVRAAAFVVRDELLGAFFVSALASVAAGLLLYRLARLDESEEVARASVFFMLAFPTAYFLHIGYTEGLFLALALGTFLAARARCWWAAGLLGALAALARVNGLLLIPALAFEAWEEYRGGGRRPRAAWLWSAGPIAGFGVYLFINWWVLGDPRAFLNAQGEYWYKSLTWPWVGIREAWNSIWARAPSEAQMVGWQELFFVLLGLALTAWAWLTMRASYAVWMSCNWLLWTSTKFVLSVPRYTLVLFPAFILLARLRAKRPAWGAAVAAWSLLFLGLFAARFAQGYWAF